MFVLVEEFQMLKLQVLSNAFVKFKSGNPQIGYKTKYRLEYEKLIEIIRIKGYEKGYSHETMGMSVDEEYDDLWNKMC